MFKVAFQQGNYVLFQEQKLRNKIQKENEDTTSYYYDVLDLCRTVNRNMD